MVKTFQLWVRVVRWIDGDTFTGIIDQGFYTYRGAEPKPVSIRCALIQAPELKTGEAGQAALAYAQQLAPPGDYPCTSYKPDDFGRPLLDLLIDGGYQFSWLMMDAGQAGPYKR